MDYAYEFNSEIMGSGIAKTYLSSHGISILLYSHLLGDSVWFYSYPVRAGNK